MFIFGSELLRTSQLMDRRSSFSSLCSIPLSLTVHFRPCAHAQDLANDILFPHRLSRVLSSFYPSKRFHISSWRVFVVHLHFAG